MKKIFSPKEKKIFSPNEIIISPLSFNFLWEFGKIIISFGETIFFHLEKLFFSFGETIISFGETFFVKGIEGTIHVHANLTSMLDQETVSEKN